MKRPDVTGIIKFSSGRMRIYNIMENTQRMLAICIIACLACSPLSSAFVKRDSDISKNSEKNFDHGLQNLVRQERQQDMGDLMEKMDNPMDSEEKLSESRIIHDKRMNEEETEDKENLIKFNKTTEDIAQNAPITYNNMHDVMHALMLADNEDINEKLQELRETKNSKEFKTLNTKRQVASAAAAASASASTAVSPNYIFGVNLDGISINELDIHSCEAEAFGYGHGHLSGLIVHEFFCELKKIFHYFLLIVRDVATELTVGPLISEEYNDIEISSEGFFGTFFHHCPPIFKTFIRHPHHLLLLPEIIKEVVPFPSISGALHRLKHVFFKLLHFAHNVYVAFKYALFEPFFAHPIGIHVRDGLAAIYHGKLHHLKGLGAKVPGQIVVTSSSASAASAASSAGAAASASTTTYSESFQEILTSFKGFYNGYHASGIPQLFKSFSTSSAYASITSFLTKIPFINYYFTPIQEDITVTTSSASSASTMTNIAPVVAPIIPIAPIAPIASEVASSSASATATVTETFAPAPIIPIVPSVPVVVSSEPVYSASSSAASATATAAASAAAAAVPAETVVSYPSVIPVTSPAIVSVPTVVEDVVAASSSASSSTVAGSGLASLSRYPFRKHKSKFAPAIGAASSSASASSVAELNQYKGLDYNVNYPFIPPKIVPSAISSSAAAAASSGVASSAASSAASSLVLPREKIIGALGYDHLLPGDIVVIALKKKGALFGHIMDHLSPIIFKFVKPKLYHSLIHKAGRVWTLLPSDFLDPGCLHHFNDPSFLQTL